MLPGDRMPTTLSPDDAEKLRAYERRRHDALAEGYAGFFAPVTALAIAPLLEAVWTGPGVRLLDVATGGGALAAEAARRGAHVIAVDLSPGMLEVARRKHPGIDFRVAEVEHLPLPDGTLDAVTSAFGIGHCPYPEAAVAECLRTLKPGGRIASSWWDRMDRQRIQGLIREAVREAGAPPPAEVARTDSTLRFCDPDEFRRLLEGAGLQDVTLDDHGGTHLLTDVYALWQGATGGMALTSSLLVHQEPAMQAAIRAALERRAAVYQTERGLALPIAFRVGAGRKGG